MQQQTTAARTRRLIRSLVGAVALGSLTTAAALALAGAPTTGTATTGIIGATLAGWWLWDPRPERRPLRYRLAPQSSRAGIAMIIAGAVIVSVPVLLIITR